jgi:hypothetical protein
LRHVAVEHGRPAVARSFPLLDPSTRYVEPAKTQT